MDERVRASLDRAQAGLSALAARLPEHSPASMSHPPAHAPRRFAAAETARPVARRDVAPGEAVRALLDRIDRIDARLGCYVTRLSDAALAEAKAAEQEIAAGGRRGPLHGVPMALKDIFDTGGVETASGAKVFKGHVPTEDAFVVRRLREAGAILVGKLNMHELAYGLTNTNPHFGPCRNPWDTERVPGGASGGSAAASAAGLCEMWLGTDAGGSSRLPAGACGIVGLKPKFGRVSRRGVLIHSWSLDHVGPMTRTVEDAALVMDAIAGQDPGDTWSAGEPTVDYAADLERGVAGLRLGVPRGYLFEGLEPAVERAVRAGIDLLAGEGATLVEVETPNLAHGYAALL